MSFRIKRLFLLHVLLLVYSFSGVFSKLASGYDFFTWQFVVYYAAILFLLVLYAVGWQQIIKKMPLSMAFANKAITVVWGLIWGIIFFGEGITVANAIGAGLVMIGVILFAREDNREAACHE